MLITSTTSETMTRVYYCPECDKQNSFPFHVGEGTHLGDVEYCDVCAGMLKDLFVFAVWDRVRQHSPLKWGAKHYLSITLHGQGHHLDMPDCPAMAEMDADFYVVDVVCHCGGNHSKTYLFRAFGEFWAFFTSFCHEHYYQLKSLVMT